MEGPDLIQVHIIGGRHVARQARAPVRLPADLEDGGPQGVQRLLGEQRVGARYRVGAFAGNQNASPCAKGRSARHSHPHSRHSISGSVSIPQSRSSR